MPDGGAAPPDLKLSSMLDEESPPQRTSLATKIASVSVVVPSAQAMLLMAMGPHHGSGDNVRAILGCNLLVNLVAGVLGLVCAIYPNRKGGALAMGLLGVILNLGMGFLMVAGIGFSGLHD